MDRDARDSHDIEGKFIPNDDIKDIFEDGEDLANDIAWFFDPRNPTTKKIIKLETAARFQPDMQELWKNVQMDFDVHSPREFQKMIDDYQMMKAKKIVSCPYVRRFYLAVARYIRNVCKNT